MAILQVNSKEELNIPKMQEYLDTDHIVELDGCRVFWIEEDTNLLTVQYAKEGFKVDLTIEPENKNSSKYVDCIELNVEEIQRLIGMDEGTAYINNMEIESVAQTGKTYIIKFYKKVKLDDSK